MNVDLHFTIFATFSEEEPCNPALLQHLLSYFENMKIGFTIYKRKNTNLHFTIEQIQIFGPKWLDNILALQIGEKLLQLKEPYDMEPAEPTQILQALPVEQIEIKELENREAVAVAIKQQNNQQTSLFFYDNDRTDCKVSKAAGNNKFDAERKSKSTAKSGAKGR
jgi:hypothetical protein